MTPRACQQKCLQHMRCRVVLYLYKRELGNQCHFCTAYPGASSQSIVRDVTNIFLAISAERPDRFQDIDKCLTLQKTKEQALAASRASLCFKNPRVSAQIRVPLPRAVNPSTIRAPAGVSPSI